MSGVPNDFPRINPMLQRPVYGDRRHRNVLRNVPWQVMSEIRDKIETMPDGNEKTILSLYFIDGLSSREIPKYCEQNGIYSRSQTNYSSRSVNDIVNKHFPYVWKYQKPNKDNLKRKEHFKYIKEHKPERCGKCGSTDNLEFHHMIPLEFGGDSIDENEYPLCANCHRRFHRYLSKKKKEWK